MQTGSRAPFSRTRVGCLTCRSRKKKCDETKPRCAACRRNQLVCDWPASVFPYATFQPADGGGDRPSRAPYIMQPPSSNSRALQPYVTVPPPVSASQMGFLQPSCGLSSHSIRLLEHYLGETASCLSMAPSNKNPFVTLFFHLGHSDDLLMHSLLAYSGAHLAYKEPNNAGLSRAHVLHYSRLISGLRTEFSDLKDRDVVKMERLLRVLLVTCQIEVITGNAEGLIFHHLKASRHLILAIMDQCDSDSQPDNSSSLQTLDFCVEIYTYLMFCNTIAPHEIAGQKVPFDSSLLSFASKRLRSKPNTVFAGAFELFQIIPEVAALASKRMAMKEPLQESSIDSLQKTHDALYDRISRWEMPAPLATECMEDWKDRQRAAEMYRQGLYIYLATARSGPIVHDQTIRSIVHAHVRKLFTYTRVLVFTEYSATMLWPVVIAGSCLVTPHEQEVLLLAILSNRYQLKLLDVYGDILQLLWNDPDPRAWGPYGLNFIMKKHQMSVAIS